MDQQKIVHLAGEVVVIGGVFLYLNKQIKNLRKELEEVQNVMVKQQEFIEKNFEGISKSIEFLMRNKQGQVPVRKQKFNITPISMDNNEDVMENEIINNSVVSNKNVENMVPTLEMSNKESFFQEQVTSIDDVSDVNEELNMIENTNIEPIVQLLEDNIKEEEPIAIEVKQPELITVKDKKKKPKAK
jgi:hypothetical protein